MPVPLILGAAAAAAAAAGVGGAISGGVKMKKANDKMKSLEERHKRNIAAFEEENRKATEAMDRLGTMELDILSTFERFSLIFERIQSKPEFESYDKEDVHIPAYDVGELKAVSAGAGVLLGGLGGAALGTAGGFAAAGATTAAVTALGTASTGTAIASLSGAAATNATLAALSGGAIAVGGGGVALGTTILGVTTLGAGLLVGGIIFSVTGNAIAQKADKAKEQVEQAESKMYIIRRYLRALYDTEKRYEKMLNSVDRIYRKHLDHLENLVILSGKTDWLQYSDQEKMVTENTALLVGLLFQMCKVQLVLADEDGQLNKVNHNEVEHTLLNSQGFMDKKGFPVTA